MLGILWEPQVTSKFNIWASFKRASYIFVNTCNPQTSENTKKTYKQNVSRFPEPLLLLASRTVNTQGPNCILLVAWMAWYASSGVVKFTKPYPEKKKHWQKERPPRGIPNMSCAHKLTHTHLHSYTVIQNKHQHTSTFMTWNKDKHSTYIIESSSKLLSSMLHTIR